MPKFPLTNAPIPPSHSATASSRLVLIRTGLPALLAGAFLLQLGCAPPFANSLVDFNAIDILDANIRVAVYGDRSHGYTVAQAAEAAVLTTHSFGTQEQSLMSIDIGSLGGDFSDAVGIDATGALLNEEETGFQTDRPRVVGLSTLPGNTQTHAFVWDPINDIVDLGTLGGPNSTAADINRHGLIVGSADTDDIPAQSHAALWTLPPGSRGAIQIADLGTLAGGSTSSARAINELGFIAGSSRNGAMEERAVRWDPDPLGGSHDIVDLGIPSGFTASIANDINNLGQIVGFGSGAGTIGAYLWPAGPSPSPVGLGQLAAGPIHNALAINDHGTVVGHSAGQAFLWTSDSGMIDLETLIDPDDPLFGQVELSRAVSIDDHGLIAARGSVMGGSTQSILLVPQLSSSLLFRIGGSNPRPTRAYGDDHQTMVSLSSATISAKPSLAVSFHGNQGEPETYTITIDLPPEFAFEGFTAIGAPHDQIGTYTGNLSMGTDFSLPVRVLDANRAYVDLGDNSVAIPGTDPTIEYHGSSHSLAGVLPRGGDGDFRTTAAPFDIDVEVVIAAGVLTNPSSPGIYPFETTLTSVDPETGGIDNGWGDPPEQVAISIDVDIVGSAIFADGFESGDTTAWN